MSGPKWSYGLKGQVSIATLAVHVCAADEEFGTPREGETSVI